MKAEYFPIGGTVSVSFDLKDLSTRDQINIFNELLERLGIRDILIKENSVTIGKIDAQISRLWYEKEK